MINDQNNIHFQHSKGENPFTVPENYFKEFEPGMMKKIRDEEGTFKVPVLQMMKPYLYIAAGFLLFFTIGRVVLTHTQMQDEVELASNTLTADQEMELIYSEVDEFTITDYLLENDVNGQVNIK